MNRILATLDLPWSATEWFWVDERFVDLAPFPPTLSFLFGIDIGY